MPATNLVYPIAQPPIPVGTHCDWARWRAVGYMRLGGLAWGAEFRPLPQKAVAPNVWQVTVDPQPGPDVDICEANGGPIAERSMQWVWVGKRLITAKSPTAVLKVLGEKLKVGGHMIVHTPLEGMPQSFTSPQIEEMLGTVGAWTLKSSMDRDGWAFVVARKDRGVKGLAKPSTVSTKPKVCVVRYGAIGDSIIMTPLLKQLDEDGYEVTVNCTTYGQGPLLNNPHIHNFIVQEREAIPNPELGPYWQEWTKEYDRYINLSESLEGKLLKVEGRKEFFSTKQFRQTTKNYYDFTMELGGYPGVTGARGEMFFTTQELTEVDRLRKQYADKFLIMWALNGSSHHKIYPFMQEVLCEFLEMYPNALCVTVGDSKAKEMEFDHPQVIRKAGQWPIRTSLAMTSVMDCVVGPETAILNAAGCYNTPKITLLSHSTEHTLCGNWTNSYALTPDTESAPCYPCMQLHYSLESCPLVTLKDPATNEELCTGPACAMGAISPVKLISRLDEVYTKWRLNQIAQS